MSTEGASDDDRGIANRMAFNEGWDETIAKVNRDRQRGEGPFAWPRPGWDADQRRSASTEEERDA